MVYGSRYNGTNSSVSILREPEHTEKHVRWLTAGQKRFFFFNSTFEVKGTGQLPPCAHQGGIWGSERTVPIRLVFIVQLYAPAALLLRERAPHTD